MTSIANAFVIVYFKDEINIHCLVDFMYLGGFCQSMCIHECVCTFDCVCASVHMHTSA